MNKLLSLINVILPPKKWSNRSPSFKKHLSEKFFKNVLTILKFLSGNDLKSMLKDLFKSRRFKITNLTRERKSLKRITQHLNERVKPKNKHFYLGVLKNVGFTQKECHNLGFIFGKKLWKSCLNSHDREIGGRPGLNPITISNINEYLFENSEESSYKRCIERDFINPFKKKNEV